MNWAVDVYGAFTIDYDDADTRTQLKVECDAALKREYKSLGWLEYLRLPLPGNPMNPMDAHLCTKMHVPWLKEFMNASKSYPIRLLATRQPVYSELLHSGSVIAFEYQYE